MAGLAWAIAALGRLFVAKCAAVAAGAALGWWWHRKLFVLIVGSPVFHSIGLGHAGGWLTAGMFLGIGYLVVRRLPPGFTEATTSLNLVAGFLVGTSAARLAFSWRPVSEPPRAAAHAALAAADRHPYGPKPDVYLIILDAYTGSGSLARNRGFDHSPFLDALRSRGFVIPRSVRANYAHTFLALPGILNWDSVQAVVPDLPADSQDPKPLVRVIEENPTWWYFARRGYRIAFFPSVRMITGRNRWASEGFAEDSNEFLAAWLYMTPAPEVLRGSRALIRLVGGAPSSATRQARMDDRRFVKLGQLHREGHPVFAFAHFLLPHDPFRFRADCSYRDSPVWIKLDGSVADSVIQADYLEQLTCVNRRVLGLVDRIRGGGGGGPEPVIILMSDHGLGMEYRGLSTLEEAPAASVAERLDAFGAVLVPAPARNAFRGDLTPIGIMRGVMREVFGLDLPDRREGSWWSSSDRPFDLAPVGAAPAP
ncbi:MAG TPA: hypothetical protein VGQ17_08505 [Gemmatimonadales bacterium]|nr:hypothetical protein [Gemmatimonadales bacterium]